MVMPPPGLAGSEEHAAMMRASFAGLIIVAAITGVAVLVDAEYHRIKRVTVQEATN